VGQPSTAMADVIKHPGGTASLLSTKSPPSLVSNTLRANDSHTVTGALRVVHLGFMVQSLPSAAMVAAR
jgi:hypothetical protein